MRQLCTIFCQRGVRHAPFVNMGNFSKHESHSQNLQNKSDLPVQSQEETATDITNRSLVSFMVLRNKKKRVPTAELPEEAQQQKRAAWRAASRRYYARKLARQQAGPPSRPAQLHHAPPSSQYPASPCGPLATANRKRAPISALPHDSQAQQREVWRASSRRYYARKMAPQQHHQNGPREYRHAEPPGGDRGGLEGILCS